MLLWILKPIGHINQPTPYLSIRFENGVISMSQVFLAQYSDIPWHIPMILLWISYYINLHQLYLRTITSYRSNGSVQGPLFRMGRSNGSAPPVIGDVPWNIPMTFSNQKSPRMDHFGWCKKLSLFFWIFSTFPRCFDAPCPDLFVVLRGCGRCGWLGSRVLATIFLCWHMTVMSRS